MNDLGKASQLRKIRNYNAAIDIYKPIWQENPLKFNDWDGWNYVFCLNKTGNYQDALQISRKLYRRFKNDEKIRSIYARSIYNTQLKTQHPPNIETQVRAIKAMFNLAPPYDKYSITPHAIFKFSKNVLRQQEINWQLIEKWLSKLDPDLLDAAPFVYQDKKGRKSEQASAVENWYAMMIKVKAALNLPEEVLGLVSQARVRKLKWHYNNDIWFSRKEAFAYLQLGNKQKAEKILRRILTRKKDWFLKYDLATVIDDKKEALELMCTAALDRGKPEMKLKLYERIFDTLKDDESEKRIAGLHLCLVLALREENGWKLETWMKEEIHKRGIDDSQEGSSSQIIKTLFPFWRKHTEKTDSKRLKGEISNILPHGKAGFVKTGKKSYYASFKGVKGTITEGIAVSFELKDSFDEKKGKPSKMAIKLRIIIK